MNIASLDNFASHELSKELIVASGGTWLTDNVWDSDNQWHFLRPGNLQNQGGIPDYNCPKYTLGYLLRKLPKNYEQGKVGEAGYNKYLLTLYAVNDIWVIEYMAVTSDEFTLAFNAETPEDAACKLTIELFKQGILK